MLLFKDKIECENPFNVIFLCGSKFVPKNNQDKRVVLKDFLLKSDVQCQVIILEENFVFTNTKKEYLAYDDIFLKNLNDIEKLVGLFADKIFIIHESISTAAEIGMLASNKTLTPKICIIYPDDISIEENKMSAFIKLAFFNCCDKKSAKPQKIIFYPDVEVHRSSKNKSEYYTYFFENKVGENLGEQILQFVRKTNNLNKVDIINNKSGNMYSSLERLSYHIADKSRIDVYIHSDALRLQLISMFNVSSYRTEFRKEKAIKDHVSFFESEYKSILTNTICYLEGINNPNSISINIIEAPDIKLRQAIGCFLYMLQAAGLIGLDKETDSLADNNRKIRITEQMESCVSMLDGYIYDMPDSAFKGLLI